MESLTLAVLGAGSVRCMPPIIGSLASYFGERPMEVRFWDADGERLDLFDRFARLCFVMNRSTHSLISTDSEAEALDGVDRVVVAIGENCALKYLRAHRRSGMADLGAEAMIEQALETLLGGMPSTAEVLSLLPDDVLVPIPAYRHLNWPPEPSEAERRAVPHQVLRFLSGDEYPHDVLRSQQTSPFRRWLDDPTVAETIVGV